MLMLESVPKIVIIRHKRENTGSFLLSVNQHILSAYSGNVGIVCMADVLNLQSTCQLGVRGGPKLDADGIPNDRAVQLEPLTYVLCCIKSNTHNFVPNNQTDIRQPGCGSGVGSSFTSHELFS